jgi:ribosomal protein S18 acetylase RimI-like enzyme
MIKKLQHTNLEIAREMRAVFQVSYAVEAQLLNAVNFPPLQRPLKNYVESNTTFFGYYKNQELAGVVEISHQKTATHINSLVVAPKFFRQGVAKQLMEFVLTNFDSEIFTVETGLQNKPASKLYQKFNFKEVKQWDTDHGVRKIRFKLSR